MAVWMIVQLLVLLWTLRTLWKHFVTSRNKFGLPEPPGPYGVPILGYVPFLGTKPHLQFAELGRKYGDIFQIQLGIHKAVVLNSLDDIKEAFKVSLYSAQVTISLREVGTEGKSGKNIE